MKNIKSEKAITLIALVITIIVLLILAGVAISMLTGDNGILRKAVEAKQSIEDAETLESIQLAEMASRNEDGKINFDILKGELNKYFGENEYTITPDSPETEDGWEVEVKGKTYPVAKGEKSTGENMPTVTEPPKEPVDKDTKYKDEKSTGEKEAVIPEGFKVSSKNNEQNIDTGLVVIGPDNNEYVWIPVPEKSDTISWGVDYQTAGVKSETDYDNIKDALLKEYTKNYKSSSYTDEWYGDESYGKYGYSEDGKTHYYSNGNLTADQYNNLYHSMLTSIYKNKGFYIGRYEMGIEITDKDENGIDTNDAQKVTRTEMKEYKASEDNDTNEAPSIQRMPTPVSQANAVPYNYITQSQAEMLAEELGKNYKTVTTSIMFGVEWDAVCVFIENCDAGKQGKIATNSTSWGNYACGESSFNLDRGYYSKTYSNNLVTWNDDHATKKESNERWMLTTGAADRNSSLNIYDFAGNMSEWTLENSRHANFPCTTRGYGYFYTDTGVAYASGRNNAYAYDSYFNNSSRPHFFIGRTEL